MPNDMGQRIRKARQARGLTQVQAARRAGWTQSRWSRLETAGNATLDTILRAALALQVPVYRLME